MNNTPYRYYMEKHVFNDHIISDVLSRLICVIIAHTNKIYLFLRIEKVS